MDDLEAQFEEWSQTEGEKLSRLPIGTETTKAKRTYIHFDSRRPSGFIKHYQNIFVDPEKVSKMALWPFLKIRLVEPRIKNKPKGVKRKKELKPRNVYFAAHRDALLYSWYSFLLGRLYESALDKYGISRCVTAYRKLPRLDNAEKNKCNIHFAKEVFDLIRAQSSNTVAIVADITGFFDNLDHDHLESEWKSLLGIAQANPLPKDHYLVFHNLTKFKYVDATAVYKAFNIKFKTKKIDVSGRTKVIKVPVVDGIQVDSILASKYTRKDFVLRVVKGNLIQGNQSWNREKRCHKGIMQGAPISAVLANLYMLSFDKEMFDFIRARKGLYMRYSDDLIIICDAKHHTEVYEKMQSEIQKYSLEIQKAKTTSTFFERSAQGTFVGYDTLGSSVRAKKTLQYLGFEFDGTRIFLKPKSLTKYYRKMKSKVRKSVSMSFGRDSKTKCKDNAVFKKSLHKKFLKKGKRSFISYALRAAKIMGGNTINRQLSRRGEIMEKYLSDRVKRHKRRRPSI